MCVEVDLDTRLPEAINLTVEDWSHVQELDYEQLPFKCHHCHGYGHFAINCKKKVEDIPNQEKNEHWTNVQKVGSTKPVNKMKGKESHQSGIQKNYVRQEVGKSVNSN